MRKSSLDVIAVLSGEEGCWSNDEYTVQMQTIGLFDISFGDDLLEAVEQWVGISIDEAQRMKGSRDKWIGLRYPLVERMMSRNDCILWLHNNYNGLEVPKSSCIGCPFHDNNTWRNLTETEFIDACLVDDAIRSTRIKFTNYLHKKRIPLREVDLRTPEDKGQLPFDFYKQERIKLFATTSPLWVKNRGVI